MPPLPEHSATKKLYLVSISSGVPSAVAADITLKRFENVELVFCDTTIEDDDNYRFLSECVARWNVPLMTLKDGRDPLAIAEDEHIIPNQYLATCTERLKFTLFRAYALEKKAQGYDVHIVLGMDWKDRNKKITRGKYAGKCRPVPSVIEYLKLGLKVYYPLLAKKTFVIDPVETVKAWGIKPPQMYSMGYTHANCGGCCVKQGAGDWRRTLINFPERFERFEKWEATQRLNPTMANYSFLRDETGGKRKTKTLEQLRAETKSATLSMFDLLDELEGKTCGVECGVSWLE
jgi:3'-phosphoadenosine 5'-phosphosulfate sulfotransferase (PAPS reductase)/FAD synthetase